jgi:sterol 14-demethylase
MIVKETEDFFKNYPKPTGLMEAYSTFGKLIILTASSCLMGKEIRASLDDTVADLYYDLDQGFKPINFIFPNLPLPSYRRRDTAREKMAALYSSIIQRRKADNDNVSRRMGGYRQGTYQQLHIHSPTLIFSKL